MTKEEFLKFHQDTCQKLFEITKAKNSDYTGNGGPFANFEQVENLGLCSTEVGILTRVLDKISRLSSFTQKGTYEVKTESFEDACLDCANYMIILAAYMHSKRKNNENPASIKVVK